jgi:hypothetical protein
MAASVCTAISASFDAGRADDLKAHPLDGGDDLSDAHPFKVFSLEGRRGKQKREALDEIHWTRFAGQTGVWAEESSLLVILDEARVTGWLVRRYRIGLRAKRGYARSGGAGLYLRRNRFWHALRPL